MLRSTGRAGGCGARSSPLRHRPSHRLVKIHRNYSIDDAATLLGIAKVTVRVITHPLAAGTDV